MKPIIRDLDILQSGPIKFAYRISVLRNWYALPGYKILEKKYSVSEPEVSALFCLGHRDNLRATDVCSITGRPKNTVSRALSLLEEKGLIDRRSSAIDRRQKAIVLTPSGHTLFKAMLTVFRDREAKILAGLNSKERDVLDKLLGKMVEGFVRRTEKY